MRITDQKFYLPGGLTNGQGSLPVAIMARIRQSGRLLVSKPDSCEIISKSDQRFQRRRFLKNCLKNSISLPWQPEFLMGSNSVNIFEEDLPRNIPAKFGSNWPSGLGGEDI